MLTTRPTRMRAALSVVPPGLLAGPALAHHVMGGRTPTTPLGARASDAAHLLMDWAPAALAAGVALLVAVAAVATVRRMRARPAAAVPAPLGGAQR